jgi:hypothetical protein
MTDQAENLPPFWARDPKIDITDAAKVELGGHTWYVPVLPLRHSKRMHPLRHELAQLQPGMTEQHVDLMIRVVHVALTRAHPYLTLDQLLDLAVTMDELLGAVPVVLAQTRAYRPAPPGTEAGE